MRAAEAMALSQSGISRAVASLERELGVELLHRRPFGDVTVTAAGGRVAELARDLVATAQTIESEATRLRAVQHDKVRVAAVPSAAVRLLPELVRRFEGVHPGIEIVSLEGSDDEVRSWLDSGVADLGVLAQPIDGLEGVPILEDEFVVLLPAGHPLSTHEHVTPNELVQSPFVLSKAGCARWLTSAFETAVEAIRVVEVSDPSTSYQIVREGLGVSIVPRLALPSDLDGVIVRSFDPPQTRQIAIAWRREGELGPGSAAFVEQCRNRGQPRGRVATSGGNGP